MTPMNTELQTQQVFRTVMRAMSNPGTIYRCDAGKQGMTALQLIAETLFDQDVTFCVIGDDQAGELEDWVYERTKSPMAEPSRADFIIVTGGSSRGRLLSAKRGSPEYPDDSATVLFSVEALASGTDGDYSARLSGPGILDTKLIRIEGLDHGDLRQLQAMNSAYPLGIDSVFIDAHGRMLCLPRSTKIEVR